MRYYILSIDEFEIINLEFSRILNGLDVNILNVKNEIEAQDIIDSVKNEFNAVIWKINNTEDQTFDSVKWLKSRNAFKNVPVIMVSERTDRKFIVKAIESGVDEYIATPFERETARRKVYKVLGVPYEEPIEDRVDDIVSYSFSELFNKEISAASRGGYPVSIMLATVISDEPEKVSQEQLNDIVRLFKKIVKARLRDTDTSFHFGSNNLIMLLPFADSEGANEVEKKVRDVFSTHSMIKKQNGKLKLIVTSVVFPEDGKIRDNLLNKLQEKQNQSMP